MRSVDHRLRLLFTSCAFAGAIAVAPAVARAAGISPIDATAAQKREATDHFTAGKQALAVSDLEKAIAELRASLAVVDSPNAHLELARALRDAGQVADAWAEYGRASETATQLAPKEERYLKTAEAAANERVDVEAKLALVAVSVANAPAGAKLKVGGRSVPQEEWNTPAIVLPGAVDVVLTDRRGVEIAHRTVTAATGQTAAVSLDGSTASAAAPEKAAADVSDDDRVGSGAAPAELPSTPPPEPAPGPRKLRPFAYVAGAIGVAGLASFTAFGLLSNSTYSDLQNVCPHGCPPNKHSEIDSGITQQTIANVSLAVGLVGLAAGTTLFLLSLPAPSSSARAALVVAPTYEGAYVGVRGSL